MDCNLKNENILGMLVSVNVCVICVVVVVEEERERILFFVVYMNL